MLSCNHIVMLWYHHGTMLSCHQVWHVVMSSCRNFVMSLCRHVIRFGMSSCHHVVILSCHYVIISSYHHVFMSSYSHVVMSSCRHVVILSCHYVIISSYHQDFMSSYNHVVMSSAGTRQWWWPAPSWERRRWTGPGPTGWDCGTSPGSTTTWRPSWLALGLPQNTSPLYTSTRGTTDQPSGSQVQQGSQCAGFSTLCSTAI